MIQRCCCAPTSFARRLCSFITKPYTSPSLAPSCVHRSPPPPRSYFLNNLTSWQYSSSDVDFCTVGDDTYFIYGMSAQSAPKNFTGRGGNFYQLGVANVTECDWLASYYPTQQ